MTSGEDAVRATYDAVAAHYAAEFLDELAGKPLDRALLDCFLEQLPAGPACDVGCGPGQIAAYLRARSDRTVLGVDLSAAMVEHAARAHPEIGFSVGTMTALDAPDGAWSGITAFYSMIHLDDGQLARAAAEFSRVLIPGGRALIAVHGGDDVMHVDSWYDRPVDLTAYQRQPATLVPILEGAGLDVDAVTRRKPYPQELATSRIYLSARKPETARELAHCAVT